MVDWSKERINSKQSGSSYLISPGNYQPNNVLTKEAAGLTLEMTPCVWLECVLVGNVRVPTFPMVAWQQSLGTPSYPVTGLLPALDLSRDRDRHYVILRLEFLLPWRCWWAWWYQCSVHLGVLMHCRKFKLNVLKLSPPCSSPRGALVAGEVITKWFYSWGSPQHVNFMVGGGHYNHEEQY